MLRAHHPFVTNVRRVACTLVLLAVPLEAQRVEARPSPPLAAAPAAGFLGLPAPFVPNRGQWDGRILFQHRTGPLTVCFGKLGWTLVLRSKAGEFHVVKMTFRDATAQRPRGTRRMSGVHNYLGGEKTVTQVPLFGAVEYPSLYAGIDVVAYNKDRSLEYDLELAPNADLDSVRVHCEGADELRLEADGSLVIATGAGEVRQKAPTTWQVDAKGNRAPVACSYVLKGDCTFGFVAPAWDRDRPLVIDPGITWSTYFAAPGNGDTVNDVVINPSDGHVIVCGHTASIGFPTTPGVWDTTAVLPDGFVSRLNPAGPPVTQLVASTFVRGTGVGTNAHQVEVHGVACPGGTNPPITIAGWTNAQTFGPTNIPTPGGGVNNNADVFVVRLDYGLTTAGFVQLLGRSGMDMAWDVAAHGNGHVTVVGQTNSTEKIGGFGPFGNANSLYGNLRGDNDAFVTRLDANGAIVATTYLNGTTKNFGNWDIEAVARAVAIDKSDHAVVVGWTSSNNFPNNPLIPAWAPAMSSTTENTDAFVARITYLPGGLTRLGFGSYLGGKGGSDLALGVDIDRYDPSGLPVFPPPLPFGDIVICGYTTADLTTFPAAQIPSWQVPAGWTRPLEAGFVIRGRANSTTSQISYGTILGADGVTSSTRVTDVAVNQTGVINVLGHTSDTGGAGINHRLPITQHVHDSAPNADGFVARIWTELVSASNHTEVVYCSYLGGTAGAETLRAGFMDLSMYQNPLPALSPFVGPSMAVAGTTTAGNYPTLNAYNSSACNSVVTAIDMSPAGTLWTGVSTPNQNGSPIVLEPDRAVVAPIPFQLLWKNAPPNKAGFLIVNTQMAANPAVINGATIYVDIPGAIYIPITAGANGYGSYSAVLFTQNDVAAIQAVFDHNQNPTWVASQALKLTAN